MIKGQLTTSKLYANFLVTQVQLGNLLKVKYPTRTRFIRASGYNKNINDTTSPHAIADYFETVTHEYLHYTSYSSHKSFTSFVFLKTGLTEYFGQKSYPK